jgi:hypothetical protein
VKRKSSTCSTGHGTGSIMPVELRTRLIREKNRLVRKQNRRRSARLARTTHHLTVAEQAAEKKPGLLSRLVAKVTGKKVAA